MPSHMCNHFGTELVSTAFVLAQPHLPTYQGGYFRLVDGDSEAEKAAMFTAARGYAGRND